MSRARVHPPKPPTADTVMACDGTAADYRRHSHRGEQACVASTNAWRVQCRMYRYTGVYDVWTNEDPTQVHPFFYRKAKRQSIKRDGVYFGKSRTKTRCPKCKWAGNKHKKGCENGTHPQ